MVKKILHHISWLYSYNKNIIIPQLLLSYFLPKTIMAGPFQGMKYIRGSTGSPLISKIIGTYEDELHEVLAAIKKKSYVRFIDIGAAEGYYVVGIKKFLLPSTREVIAYEATARGRRQIKKLSILNACSDVQVAGFCDAELLSRSMNSKRTLIMVDIEGGEFSLLNPRLIDFTNCDLLVELHDDETMARKRKLIEDFLPTHRITEIAIGQKSLPRGVNYHRIIRKHAAFAMNEFRNMTQSWLFMERKGE